MTDEPTRPAWERLTPQERRDLAQRERVRFACEQTGLPPTRVAHIIRVADPWPDNQDIDGLTVMTQYEAEACQVSVAQLLKDTLEGRQAYPRYRELDERIKDQRAAALAGESSEAVRAVCNAVDALNNAIFQRMVDECDASHLDHLRG